MSTLIVSFHAPGMVFENHTAGERAEGPEVRDHIAGIFANWPDLAFRGRRLYARDGSRRERVDRDRPPTRTGRRLEWDGIDVFPFENGLILRKDVYSAGHRPRVVSLVARLRAQASRPCHRRAAGRGRAGARARLRARRRAGGCRRDRLDADDARRRRVPRPRRAATPRRRELRGRREQHRSRRGVAGAVSWSRTRRTCSRARRPSSPSG